MSTSVPSVRSESISRYEPKVFVREWGTETFLCETPYYLVKRLDMKAGTKGGLQRHIEKVESFYLLDGDAWVEYDDGTGKIVGVYMYPGQTYDIPAQAVHRVEAITDCVFIEGSTPAYDDRYHAEAEYGQEVETGGLPSTWSYDPAFDRYTRKEPD